LKIRVSVVQFSALATIQIMSYLLRASRYGRCTRAVSTFTQLRSTTQGAEEMQTPLAQLTVTEVALALQDRPH
jgi:hypothetical protein